MYVFRRVHRFKRGRPVIERLNGAAGFDGHIAPTSGFEPISWQE